MREFIIENLNNAQTVSLATIVLNNIIAIVGAFFLMFTYKLTYSGTGYSSKFNVSLGAITIITAMIMCIIGNNVALSLGMVGALSIIRFRTAVKDVRDATYIFWALAVGIGCGVSQYTLVCIGCIFVFLFFVLTRQTSYDQKQLLIVQGELQAQNEVESVVENHFGKDAHQTIKNVTSTRCELIYSIKENALAKANEKYLIDISQRLIKIEGVTNVNLVEQLDDIGR